MIDEQQLSAFDAEPLADERAHPELFVHPRHHRVGEGAPGAGVALQRGEQDALELYERLLVEDDVVEVSRGESTLLEAELDRSFGETRIMLLPRESLLLGGGDQTTVVDQRCRGVVVEAGNPENLHAGNRDASRIPPSGDRKGSPNRSRVRRGAAIDGTSELTVGVLQSQGLARLLQPPARRWPLLDAKGIREQFHAQGERADQDEVEKPP